jgi:hypothetical protein
MRLDRASSLIALMPKKPRTRPSLPDRFCEAIKELTAERQTRTYAAQWIMVHSVARHLGISDEQAQEAIKAAGHRLKRAGDPPHSVSLIYGWNEIQD